MTLSRRATRAPSHKPHIFKPHQSYKCFTHNASGEGSTPEEAYESWQAAQRAFEVMQFDRSLP